VGVSEDVIPQEIESLRDMGDCGFLFAQFQSHFFLEILLAALASGLGPGFWSLGPE
jgi:hypothetical protein